MSYVDHISIDGAQYDIRDAEAVSFEQEQTLTDAQKAQARANIGAGSEADVDELKSAFNVINERYWSKSMQSDSESIIFENTGIILNQGDQIIIDSKVNSSYAVVRIRGQSEAPTSIGTIGTYAFTAEITGTLYVDHRALDIDIYYPTFNIVSISGNSKIKAASQKLVKDVSDSVSGLDSEIDGLRDALDDKYDRYKVESLTGLSLDDFSICPELYTIVQYQDSDCLKTGNPGFGNYLLSKFDEKYTDIKFKIGSYFAGGSVNINLACTAEKAIGFRLNLASSNVNLFTGSSIAYVPGIYITSDGTGIVAEDVLHCKRNGKKVALYVERDGIDKPIFEEEWIDVIEAYGSYGFTNEDVCIGFTSDYAARGEYLIWDVTKVVASGNHFMPYNEVDARLTALEDGAGYNPSRVDLFMFMGQSNMAGRGTGSQAPEVIAEAGYEFRAITDPTKLYPITEPFGLDENVENKIYDYLGGYKAKSGDMVPAFVNAYFTHTHVSIVGISASEGGTRIALWQPDTARDTDALARYNAAINWLTSNGYTIRHKYMLWCQGESNGDDGMSKADYKSAFSAFANAWFSRGIETIFLVKIGNYNGTGTQDYNTIMTAQNEICQETPNVVMVSTDFAGMKARGLMKDDFHYQQAAYNEVGNYAGINTAIYVNMEKEPTMYDTQDGTLYYTHKN